MFNYLNSAVSLTGPKPIVFSIRIPVSEHPCIPTVLYLQFYLDGGN